MWRGAKNKIKNKMGKLEQWDHPQKSFGLLPSPEFQGFAYGVFQHMLSTYCTCRPGYPGMSLVFALHHGELVVILSEVPISLQTYIIKGFLREENIGQRVP